MNETSTGTTETYTGTERLLAFSAGVFAIAITLLVLTIGVPHVVHGLRGQILQQWPHYLGLVLSFFVIGIIWAQHHEMFTLITRSNHAFVLINIIFVMWVVVVPFPTALLTVGLSTADAPARRAAVVIYVGMFLLGAVLVNLQWRYARAHRRLLAEDASDDRIRRTTRSQAVGPLVYLVDLLVAFVSIEASVALFCVIALFYAIAPLPAIHRVIIGRGQREEQ